MGVNDKLVKALARATELAGTSVRLRYYIPTIGSVWDDELTGLTPSGTLWFSGVVFPLNTSDGSTDSVLLKEGKLINLDKKLYVNGSITFAGSSFINDIMVGSPSGELYTPIPLGGIVWEAQGIPVYKVQYIRRFNETL